MNLFLILILLINMFFFIDGYLRAKSFITIQFPYLIDKFTVGQKPLISKNPIHRSRLHVDIFGLGPSEVLIIAIAGAVLYGPGRLQEQLRAKKKDVSDIEYGGEPWQQEIYAEIDEKRKTAKEKRTIRAIQRYLDTENEDDE